MTLLEVHRKRKERKKKQQEDAEEAEAALGRNNSVITESLSRGKS